MILLKEMSITLIHNYFMCLDYFCPVDKYFVLSLCFLEKCISDTTFGYLWLFVLPVPSVIGPTLFFTSWRG